jgi:flagellar motor protein MotB
VSKVHYDRCVSDAARAASAADAKAKADALRTQSLRAEVTAAQALVQDGDSKLSELSTANHNTQTQLDEATAMNQQLRTELQRLGRDVDKVLSERGTLSKALDDAKSRLDELRKAQAAAQLRVDLFRVLASRFKPLVDAGQMRIETRRGQPVLEVSGDVLFDPGRSDLRSSGRSPTPFRPRRLAAAADFSSRHSRMPLTPRRGLQKPLGSSRRRERSWWSSTSSRWVCPRSR